MSGNPDGETAWENLVMGVVLILERLVRRLRSSSADVDACGAASPR